MRTSIITGLLMLALVTTLRADNERAPVAEESSSSTTSSKDIADWIKRLDSDRFADRREAKQKLEAIGDAAIKPLAEAAIGDSREVTTSALDILRKHFENGSESSKKVAKEALEKIAATNHSAAQRAKDILKPPAPAQAGIFQGGVLPIAPGQIQIRINAIANGRQMKRIQVNNGVKTIQVEDNGQKIKIVDDPNNGIEMEITEEKDGKPKTEKFSAKNADELKKKHPDAYKMYEKHSRNAGGIQINGIQIQPGQIVPAGPIQPAPAPNAGPANDAAMRKIAKMQLQSAQRQLQSAKRMIGRLKPGEDEKPEDLKKTMEKLDEIAKQIEQEQAKLGE